MKYINVEDVTVLSQHQRELLKKWCNENLEGDTIIEIRFAPKEDINSIFGSLLGVKYEAPKETKRIFFKDLDEYLNLCNSKGLDNVFDIKTIPLLDEESVRNAIKHFTQVAPVITETIDKIVIHVDSEVLGEYEKDYEVGTSYLDIYWECLKSTLETI